MRPAKKSPAVGQPFNSRFMATDLSETDKQPDVVKENAASDARMTVKVSEIRGVIPYGFYLDHIPVVCDPSPDDINQALDADAFELRGFQTHLPELQAEWGSASSAEDYCLRVKTYHARRIAQFVRHGWTDPIALTKDKTITDGLHRLRAAIHKGMEEVEVTIP